MFSRILLNLLILAVLALVCIQLQISASPFSLFKKHKVAECGSNEEPQLFITISSLASVTNGKITKRQLEINWSNLPYNLGDMIIILNHDPTESISNILDFVSVKEMDHFYRSDIQFPKVTFDSKNLTSNCFAFWVAYVRMNYEIIRTACIRARPTWMSDIRKRIGKRNLTSIMLPGTHDSGSYIEYNGTSHDNRLTRYVYTQEDDIFTQFCFGIRSVDLRIGYNPRSEEKFWINHDFIQTVNPLSKVLHDVQRFLSLTKDEIVILDFHRFPEGFEDVKIHVLLIERLVAEFGKQMIPKTMGYSATYDEIIDSGKRVLVAYNNDARIGHDLLWPGVNQKWGDEQLVYALKDFFDDVFREPLPNKLWSAQAELTPTATDIVLKPNHGLRYLANQVNGNVTEWFSGEWGYRSNIVTTDFYLGNNIVQVAIDVNTKKCSCVTKHVDLKMVKKLKNKKRLFKKLFSKGY